MSKKENKFERQHQPIINQLVRPVVTIEGTNVCKPRQRRSVKSVNEGKSMTKQSDTQDANIHCILKNYRKTGLLPVNQAEPLKGDLPGPESFHEAMSVVVEAQQSFDQLPAEIRQKFGNDPAAFLEFVAEKDEEGNHKNFDQMVDMGLASPIEPSQADETLDTLKGIEKAVSSQEGSEANSEENSEAE